MVRWYESYLVDPEFGHIPVGLYEVFILFCLITSLLYLFYESRYRNRTLGGFVMLVVRTAAVMSCLVQLFAAPMKSGHWFRP
ncbi:MAG: hypothetical protein R3E89_04230 [Thiolinea sp.]